MGVMANVFYIDMGFSKAEIGTASKTYGLIMSLAGALLAGILVTVGIGVMDYKGLKAIPYMPKPEVAIMLIVLVLSSVWNLVYAVGIGLVIASLMFMKKIGDLTAERSEIEPVEDKGADDDTTIPSELKKDIYVKYIKGPLFFGSTSDIQELANN